VRQVTFVYSTVMLIILWKCHRCPGECSISLF